MALDPDIAAQVAHLFDATLAQVLSGEVPGAPAGPPLRRDDVTIADTTVPGHGGAVPVRVYRPVGTDETLPALVWVHGGGWQYGGLDMPEADSVAQVVAATVPAIVVSVDYRLAPAHRFPAALDDVVAAHRWVSGGGLDGVDTSRVAMGGASAGAHLSAGAALTCRSVEERPAALWLAYPVTDPLEGPYPDHRHPDCPPLLWLDRDSVAGLFRTFVGTPAGDLPPTAVPGRADLSGFPPTLVTTAECDALAAQAQAFADAARAAGVEVTVHDVGGLLHGYLNTIGGSPLADRALARHVDWLRATMTR